MGAVVAAVLKYADEGRYVPDALDLLEKLAGDRRAELLQFYTAFLPRIPPKRGTKPSEYAVAMHKRAIELAGAENRPDLAEAFTERLRLIGQGKLEWTDPNGRG